MLVYKGSEEISGWGTREDYRSKEADCCEIWDHSCNLPHRAGFTIVIVHRSLIQLFYIPLANLESLFVSSFDNDCLCDFKVNLNL